MVKMNNAEVNFGEHIKVEKALINALNAYSIEIADPMIFFTNRLATFTNWPFKQGSCTPEHMAYAGYHVIQDDCAKCVFCCKELDGWEETDDPWKEHSSHKPDCALVKLNKRDITTWLIEEFMMLNSMVVKNKVMEEFRTVREEFVQRADDCRTAAMDSIKKLSH